MKYLLIGVAGVCLSVAGCSAAPSSELASATPATVAAAPPVFSPAILDLGTCVEGDVLSGIVTLTNPGSDAITISKIDASCGCSSAGNIAGTVKASQTCRVPVSVRTKGKSGNFRGTFYVNYEQGGITRKCSFDIKAVIRTPGRIVASPANVDLATRKPGEQVHAIVELSPEDLSDPNTLPSIVRVEAPDWLKTNLREQADAAHKWSLELTGIVPNTAGSLKTVVQVFTDCERFPVCRIPVLADVAGVLQFESKSIVKVVTRTDLPAEIPVRLTMLGGKSAAENFRSIELAGFEGAELEVSTPTFEDRTCTARVTLRSWNQPTSRVIKGEVIAKGIVDGQVHSASLPMILVMGNANPSAESIESE